MASTRRDEIVAEASVLLDQAGREAVTMRRLAERLGIQAPSLYKHVAGKDELEAMLVTQGLEELGRAVVDATTSGERLGSMARAYRAFARRRPHLYRLLTERPLARDHRPGPGEAEAVRLLMEATGTPDRARAAWAFVHGMTQLELADRFPPGADVEAAWEAGLAAFAVSAPGHAEPALGIVEQRGRELLGPASDEPSAASSASDAARAAPPAERPPAARRVVRSWRGPD